MSLLAKIEQRSAVVGVIGLGYVGLPLLAAFHKAGFPVLGFDVDPRKIEMLHRGENYLKHLGADLVANMKAAGRFDATADMSRLAEADAIIVCVPTPLGKHLEPDVGYIEKAADDIAKTLRPGQLIALESSTYPRTTREVMLPRFEAKGMKCGVDFFLAFSPEREDPGRKDHNTQSIPKLVGGIDKASGEIAVALYRRAIQQIIPVSTAEVAEAAKLLENIYRSVNIALVNELKMVLSEMGIDVWEVIEAAKTKPFGFQAFYPGPGLGGHCLAGGEFVFVCDPARGQEAGLEAVRLSELFERHAAHSSYEIGEVEATDVRRLKALSVDPETGEARLAPVTQLFRRPCATPLLKIRLRDNRTLTVTDGHPMLVHDDERIVMRRAEDLSEGDDVVLLASWPRQQRWSARIDLLDVAARTAAGHNIKVRVTPQDGAWRDHERVVRPILLELGESPKDAFRHNTISMAACLHLEKAGKSPFPREQLLLATGKGRSWNKLPAVLDLNEDLARLIGYYLSEGCITTDGPTGKRNGGLRVRFAFGSHETELIADLQGILGRLGIRCSGHQLRSCATYQVKVSSSLLTILLRDELVCGVRSEDARVPARLMHAPESIRRALLAGLLRGDGDVHVENRLRNYRKRDRLYRHRLCAATVGYFSSSPVLLQQVSLLMQGLGLVPHLKRGKPQLRLCGVQAMAMEPLLAGAKQEKLTSYRQQKTRTISGRTIAHHGSYATAAVASIERVPAEAVYSMEVEGTHTFVTSYGIAVHNCIPIDPYYLTWKAREVNMPTRFIELAGEVNRHMPEYVVGRVAQALNDRGKAVKDSKILVLGLAYKPDIDDVRESPSFELIEELEHMGAHVDYNDPLVPQTHYMRRWGDIGKKSVELSPQSLRGYDCVIISTHHSAYDWQMVADCSPLIVDTRNALAKTTGRRDHIVKA